MISWMLIMLATSMDGSYYTWSVKADPDTGRPMDRARCEDLGKDVASNDGDARQFVCVLIDVTAHNGT